MSDEFDFKALEIRLDKLQAEYAMLASPMSNRAEREARLEKRNFPKDSNPIFEEIAPVYWEATAEQREKIRQIFRNRSYFATTAAFAFAETMAKEITQNRSVGSLRLGLVAISIQNCNQDFRDSSVALGKLCTAAKNVRINPEPYLLEVAAISSEVKSPGGSQPMNAMLTQLAEYYRTNYHQQ
jgi:hypothetical protein